MANKFALLLLIGISVLVSRLAINFSSKTTSGPITFKGEVASIPTLQKGSLNFRVGKYLVISKYQNLDLGDRVEVSGNLSKGKVVADKVEKLPKPWLEERLFAFRNYLKEAIYRYFPDPQASLLTGITLGQNLLPRDFKNDLVATGTIHVVVVSGYNISIVGQFILVLAPYLGRRKTSLLAIATIVCYTFLVGFTAPTLRATAMGIITLTGVLLGRKTLALWALTLSAYLLLIWNPDYLTDISFQLSFLATLGVLLFTTPISNKLTRLHKFWKETLATTLGAQILVLPLLFYYFGTIALSAPIVNTLVLWVIPVTTLLGFVFLAVSSITILGQVLALILLAPLSFFTQIVSAFASLRFLLLQVEPNNWLVLIGYYLLLSSLIVNFKIKRLAKRNEAKNVA